MSQNHLDNKQASLDALLDQSTVFDDVLPEPIRVSIVEFQERVSGQTLDNDGAPVMIRVPVARIAIIGTYVPMKVLHKMMASQEKLKRIQALTAQQAEGGMSQEGQGAMLGWMVDQVLEVWKLTEPFMTSEKLAEGLSYKKVFGLFGLFFGDLLKQLNNQN
ncbi:MAG: hypothetical protein NVS4B1_33480 [Ktedonobacteraceae bacterium]